MSQRFYSQTPIGADAVGRTVVLTGGEAHHLAHVMRAKTGQTVDVFDGSGAEFSAQVRHVGKSQIELLILDRREVDRELPYELTLAVALPKGDRQRWLVEKATELGVTRLVPLVTARGVAQAVLRAIDRLRQTVIEASKQCGRNRLMEITPAARWSDYVVQAPLTACRLFANPQSESRLGERLEAKNIIAAIGPEGGWTDEEFALAIQHTWRPINLGPRTLRVETAAVLIAALAVGWVESARPTTYEVV